MDDRIAVWLAGTKIAVICRDRERIDLTYTPDALKMFPAGTPLLTLSLPLVAQRYSKGIVRPFLDGLLAEGESRSALARRHRVSRDDTFGLISALGRDCAGALVIQPEGEPDPPSPSILTAEPINDSELAELVTNLPNAPLGIDDRVRISLAGVQEKLLLTRMSDGGWGRPVDGTPSTHILKPEIARFTNTVENEVFAMRVAKHLGIDVAPVEMITIADCKLIVVERFDRVVRDDGSVARLHQEDLCQATGIPPEKKHQEDGGPSLRRIAEILDDFADAGDVAKLLRVVTLNVVIGNGDAHGKNFSLLHREPGTLQLAPAYDLMSTLPYGDDQLAMYIDDVRQTSRVTGDRLANEAVSWGLPRRRAAEIIADLLDRVPDAVTTASAEVEGVPPAYPALIESQLAQLRTGLDTAKPSGF